VWRDGLIKNLNKLKNPVTRFKETKLVIHEKSFQYISQIALYISGIIQQITNTCVSIHKVANIESINKEYTLYFIIGDGFLPYPKMPNSFYIFINFSLLFNLNYFKSDYRARKWITSKYRLFLSKVSCFDVVLDYYLKQSDFLREELRKYDIPVLNFMTGTKSSIQNPMYHFENNYKWDIGFVGTITARRAKILQELAKTDLILSPLNGISMEELVKKSKIILNIHAHKCLTAEIPRIVETLRNGGCLITEESPGIENIAPSSCYINIPYNKIFHTTKKLSDNLSLIKHYRASSLEYMINNYDRLCLNNWQNIISSIEKHIDSKHRLQKTASQPKVPYK
jgi:hypothetical protein